MFGLGEGFEDEVPLARVSLFGDESSTFVLVARAALARPSLIADMYCNLQGDRLASLEAHLDKASTIPVCCRDCGPHRGVVNQ